MSSKTKSGNVVPEGKLKSVKELENLINNKKTILITSIKNIPGGQFQEIVKKIRGKAIVKVPKKNLIFRAIDNSAKDSKELSELKEKIGDSFAILFSDLDSFELAGELMKSQSPAKAKAGQEAPLDIEIPEGPTDMVPGPAVSELGALGIKIKIENGKITISEPKIIAKEGEKMKENAVALMNKLDIKPFKIGFVPVCAFDNEKKVLYTKIKIDPEETIEELRFAYGKALPFALEIGYVTQDTVKLMISKAGSEEKRLVRVISGEPEEETPVEETKEESPKENEKAEEPKADATAGLAGLFG